MTIMCAHKEKSGNIESAPFKQKSALPGRGGISRIIEAASNSLRGIRDGAATEAAIQQELAVVAIAIPLSFFVARTAWIWVALIASLLLVLAIEFLNTAIERLCNHVEPRRHDAIRITKDLASAAVTMGLLLAGLVWLVAALDRFGYLP